MWWTFFHPNREQIKYQRLHQMLQPQILNKFQHRIRIPPLLLFCVHSICLSLHYSEDVHKMVLTQFTYNETRHDQCAFFTLSFLNFTMATFLTTATASSARILILFESSHSVNGTFLSKIGSNWEMWFLCAKRRKIFGPNWDMHKLGKYILEQDFINLNDFKLEICVW